MITRHAGGILIMRKIETNFMTAEVEKYIVVARAPSPLFRPRSDL